MLAANHGKAICTVEITAARQGRHGNFARVDGIIHRTTTVSRYGANAQHPVFGVENDAVFGRNQIRHERRDADAEVHDIAFFQFCQRPFGHVHPRFIHFFRRTHRRRRAQIFKRDFSFNQVIYKTTRGMHKFRSYFAYRNNLFYFGNHQISSGRHSLVEVIFGHAVLQIPCGIGSPRPNKGHVAAQCFDKNLLFTVNDFGFSAFSNERSRRSGRIKPANTRPSCTKSFGKCSLR